MTPREAVIEALRQALYADGQDGELDYVLDKLLAVRVPCSTCAGTGTTKFGPGPTCKVCHGRGYVGALTMTEADDAG